MWDFGSKKRWLFDSLIFYEHLFVWLPNFKIILINFKYTNVLFSWNIENVRSSKYNRSRCYSTLETVPHGVKEIQSFNITVWSNEKHFPQRFYIKGSSFFMRVCTRDKNKELPESHYKHCKALPGLSLLTYVVPIRLMSEFL